MVRVDRVTPVELDSEDLRGGAIDAPAEGSESVTYALDVEGWAVGRRARAVAVEFAHLGMKSWQVPLNVERSDLVARFPDISTPERSGFRTSLNSLRLPPAFELRVRAVLEDDSRADLGTITGRRDPLRSSFEPRIQPLILTSLGRTGTTLMTALLDAHPGVFAFPAFRYEPRATGYWMGVFLSLSEPAGYVRQVVAPYLRKNDWWLATENAPGERSIPDAEVETWIGANSAEPVAAFCQSRIDALYAFAADNFGSANPAYFLEKYEPGWIPSFVSELYPKSREVILVRDFRDMVCSVLAFNAKIGYQAFLRERVETDEQYVHYISEQVSRLWEASRQRKDSAHLVRYEDLILNPAGTLEALLRYLSLDRDGETIEAMLNSLSQREGQTERHRTSADAEESIGRWRQDLSVELQRACDIAFGPALEAFGYEPSG